MHYKHLMRDITEKQNFILYVRIAAFGIRLPRNVVYSCQDLAMV